MRNGLVSHTGNPNRIDFQSSRHDKINPVQQGLFFYPLECPNRPVCHSLLKLSRAVLRRFMPIIEFPLVQIAQGLYGELDDFHYPFKIKTTHAFVGL